MIADEWEGAACGACGAFLYDGREADGSPHDCPLDDPLPDHGVDCDCTDTAACRKLRHEAEVAADDRWEARRARADRLD